MGEGVQPPTDPLGLDSLLVKIILSFYVSHDTGTSRYVLMSDIKLYSVYAAFCSVVSSRFGKLNTLEITLLCGAYTVSVPS